MTIIECMKRLRVIEKRIDSNAQDITRYASMINTQIPLFESQEKQREEVARRVQANVDLVHEYLRLKRRLERTNLAVRVKIQNKEYSISELIVLRRKLIDSLLLTYSSLNDFTGKSAQRSAPNIQGQAQAHVVRLYKEEDKQAKLRKWMDFKAEIDGRLEVVNATTQLLDDE
jgi:hypothetical protein